jgi:hypothetical protein
MIKACIVPRLAAALGLTSAFAIVAFLASTSPAKAGRHQDEASET